MCLQDGYWTRAPRSRWKAPIVQPPPPSAINYGPWSKALSQKIFSLQSSTPHTHTQAIAHTPPITARSSDGTEENHLPLLSVSLPLLMKPRWVLSREPLQLYKNLHSSTAGKREKIKEEKIAPKLLFYHFLLLVLSTGYLASDRFLSESPSCVHTSPCPCVYTVSAGVRERRACCFKNEILKCFRSAQSVQANTSNNQICKYNENRTCYATSDKKTSQSR